MRRSLDEHDVVTDGVTEFSLKHWRAALKRLHLQRHTCIVLASARVMMAQSVLSYCIYDACATYIVQQQSNADELKCVTYVCFAEC
jgi:hypothetical protein